MSVTTIGLLDQIDLQDAAAFFAAEPGVADHRGFQYDNPQERGTLSALVVEDDPQIRNMLEITLALEGIEVESVGDGSSALELLQTKQPDVVLLDIMMPVLNGYAVLKHLRDATPVNPVPVIILTAKAGDEDVWEGWSCGADSYMTKPVDIELLFKEIARVTSGTCLA